MFVKYEGATRNPEDDLFLAAFPEDPSGATGRDPGIVSLYRLKGDEEAYYAVKRAPFGVVETGTPIATSIGTRQDAIEWVLGQHLKWIFPEIVEGQ